MGGVVGLEGTRNLLQVGFGEKQGMMDGCQKYVLERHTCGCGEDGLGGQVAGVEIGGGEG